MKTRTVRSFSPEPDKKLELVLEHSGGSRFFWLENQQYAKNQIILFGTYNPKLLIALGKLERLGKRSMTRLEIGELLGQTNETIGFYFRKIRPDMAVERASFRGRSYMIPIYYIYEMLVDFMPILEDWETNASLSKRMDLSLTAIGQHHRSGNIESRRFMAKIRVSPVGLGQLRDIIRSPDGSVVLFHETYYYPAQIAREAMILMEENSDDKERFNNLRDRIAHLIRYNRHQLGAMKIFGRWGVKTAMKDKLCDAIRKFEAAEVIGVTKDVLKRLIRKGSIKCYLLGRRKWVSLSSCREYLTRRMLRC